MTRNLRFCVVKQLQSDAFLVDVAHHDNDPNTTKCLLRVVSLNCAANSQVPAHTTDNILRNFCDLQKALKETQTAVPFPLFVSIPPVPPAFRGKEIQVHAFFPSSTICGLRQHTLQHVSPCLPRTEESLWRLLALLCHAMSVLQPERDDCPFFTYFGNIDDTNVFIQVEDPHVHNLKVALALPNSLYYDFLHGAQGKSARMYWAQRDMQAVGRLIFNVASQSLKIDCSPELQFILRQLTKEEGQVPMATQIMRFQAVALRMRCWNCEATLQSMRRQMLPPSTNSSGVVSPRTNSAGQCPCPGPDESLVSLARREELVRQRESKIEIFLELYQLTMEQLDRLPERREDSEAFRQHYSQSRNSDSKISPVTQRRVVESTQTETESPLKHASPPHMLLDKSPAFTPVLHAGDVDGDFLDHSHVPTVGSEPPRQPDFDDTACEIINIGPETPKRYSQPEKMPLSAKSPPIRPPLKPVSPPAKGNTLRSPNPSAADSFLSLKSCRARSATAEGKMAKEWMSVHIAELQGMQEALRATSVAIEARCTPPKGLSDEMASKWQASARRERAARLLGGSNRNDTGDGTSFMYSPPRKAS